MIKRLTAGFLSLCIILSITTQVFGAKTPPIAEGSVENRLNQLMETFPAGSYFTVTGNSCTHGRGSTCTNCSLHKIMDNMGYDNTNRPWNSWTCVGFARFAFWYMFGVADCVSSYTGVAPTGSKITTISNARPGDMVVLKKNGSNHHYGIYLSHTTNSNGVVTVTVFDANGTGSSTINQISHTTTFTYESGSYIVTANNYDELNKNAEPKSVFDDVSTNAYYYDSVLWAVENGIAAGTGNSMFSPDLNATLGQVLLFLYRADGSKTVNIDNPFIDVFETDYYYDAVLWAYENGMISSDNGLLNPDTYVTRAEIIEFLYKLSGSPMITDTFDLDDVNESDYFYDAVNFALKKGITKGTTDTTFEPYGLTTRSQIVTFLDRAFN